MPFPYLTVSDKSMKEKDIKVIDFAALKRSRGRPEGKSALARACLSCC